MAGVSDTVPVEGVRKISESSLSSDPNGVASLTPKPSSLPGVFYPVFSNDPKKTDTYLNSKKVNADDDGLTEQIPAPFPSVTNASSNTDAINGSKVRVHAFSVTAPTASDGGSHAKPVGGSAERASGVSFSSSDFFQTTSEVREAQMSDNVGIPPVVTHPSGTKAEQWAWLKKKVLSCPNCLKHVPEGRKPVFGSGNLDADIFFCGEAPGAEEEEQGEVFVGRAGQLLTKIIEAMGLRRSDVYIGNIMNWRPETPNRIGNRPPTQE